MIDQTQASSPPDGTATTTTEDVSALGAILGQALAPLVTSVTTALEALPAAAALNARVDALEAGRAGVLTGELLETEDNSADAAAVLAGGQSVRVASYALEDGISAAVAAVRGSEGTSKEVKTVEPHCGAILGAVLGRPIDATTKDAARASNQLAGLTAATSTAAPGTITLESPRLSVATRGFIGAIPVRPMTAKQSERPTFTRYAGFDATSVTVNSWAIGSGGKTLTLTVTSHHLTGNPYRYAGTVVLTDPAVNQFAQVIAFTSTTITVRVKTVVAGTPSGGGTISAVLKSPRFTNTAQGVNSVEITPVLAERTLHIGSSRGNMKATLRHLETNGDTVGTVIAVGAHAGLEWNALNGDGSAEGKMEGVFNVAFTQYRRGSESSTSGFPLGAVYFQQFSDAYTEMLGSGFRPTHVAVPSAVMTALRFALDANQATADLLSQLEGLTFIDSEQMTTQSVMFTADQSYIGLQPQAGSNMLLKPIASDEIADQVTAGAAVYATLVVPMPLSVCIIDHAV